MRTSISTTSGARRLVRSIASRPVAGVAGDLDRRVAREQLGEPGAHQVVVVGDQHADHPRLPAYGSAA